MHDLDHLAQLVDEIAEQHPRTALPLLVWSRGTPPVPDVEVVPLDGDHPATVLLGATAPPGTTVAGVVATGWSHPTACSARPQRRIATRATVLVGADGTVAGRLLLDGSSACVDAPGSGLLLDLLRRVLGCPTDPPDVPLVELFACVWLAQLAVSDPGAPWPEVAGVHLAEQVCPGGDGAELVERAVAVAEELGWAGLRRVVQAGGWPEVCPPDLADWLDEGSFARWVLGRFPPVDALVAAAVADRPAAVADRIRRAVERWGFGGTDR